MAAGIAADTGGVVDIAVAVEAADTEAAGIAAAVVLVADTAADRAPVAGSQPESWPAEVDSKKTSVLRGVPGNLVYAAEFLRYLLRAAGGHNFSRLPAHDSGSRNAAIKPVAE